MAKVIITRYDPKCKKPPFMTYKVDEMEVDVPESKNDGGLAKYTFLYGEVEKKGYRMRFLSGATDFPGYDLQVIVS